MRILVIDVGGTHVKVLATGQKRWVGIPSGPKMTPAKMVAAVRVAAAGWNFDAVSLGYPGPVVHGRPLTEPHNLGAGWIGFDFKRAFGRRPVKIINDAAMQALGSYKGKRMLFLGLGTGLGSAMIVDGVLEPFAERSFAGQLHDFLGLDPAIRTAQMYNSTTIVVRYSKHDRSRTSRSLISAISTTVRPQPEHTSLPALRRTHSFSVLASSSISLRYTR